ncbi:hypothetical protein NDA16_002616 [Ustilago loliicola]|nr:hypothetical protein NDA16_002616 [Ustilago loliicola]
MSHTQVQQDRIQLSDGVEVFYRHAGPADAPPFLLLHGMPSSSFQYRNLIPALATRFRVIAPDLPGFGFTVTPQDYIFNFDNLSKTIERFIDALQLNRLPFPVYIFDYGAPVALRILSRRPEVFSTIVTQNGNAYEAGLAPAWEEFGIRRYWREPTAANRDSLRELLSLPNTKFQYTHGHPDPHSVPPETYTLDHFLSVSRTEAMMDLFGDYKNNVALYPTFQEALSTASKQHKLRVLAIWGQHDPFFLPAGAEAYKSDVADTEVIILNTGHFALESHLETIAGKILDFVH